MATRRKKATPTVDVTDYTVVLKFAGLPVAVESFGVMMISINGEELEAVQLTGGLKVKIPIGRKVPKKAAAAKDPSKIENFIEK